MSDYQNSPAPQQPQDQPTEAIPQNFQTMPSQPDVPQPPQTEYGQPAFGQPAYAQNPYQQAPQPGQSYPPQGVYQPYEQPVDQRWNNLCIVGFVLAFFIPLAGLIISIVAMVQINKSGERSKGMAVAGIIVSAAIMLINIIIVMLFVNAFINLMQREFGSVDFNSSSYSDDNYDSPFDNQDRQELEDLLNQLESEQQS